MKTAKKILFIALLVLIVFSLVACGGGNNGGKSGGKSGGNSGGDNSGSVENPETGRPISTLKASDLKALTDLVDYGKSQATYAKTATTFSETTYDGKDASTQLANLQARIDQKNADVVNGDSDSSFIKIFAMSTPAGLMERMAQAALTYDEMVKVVEYLYGSEENPDVGYYLGKTQSGAWDGKFSDGTTTWRSQMNASNTDYFNAGWSFFDDWELYDRMKDFTEDATEGANKDLAGDNAAWQYRSILKKVYTQVGLSGDAAARLATYMLDYAIDIVEAKSLGKADDALTVVSGNVTYGAFADYCMREATASDPFYGLHDYETLSYLLAFNDYYDDKNGLSDCVTLYGYYYDYNKTYYFESLADEETYEKQLKYEKQETFTDAEWLEYVGIQRHNYAKAYRYSEAFYTDFYAVHFEFQGIIEDKDASVYQMAKVRSEYNLSDTKTTYTQEMRTATTKTGTINGIAGQLAMSDWMWCYSASDDCMKLYNQANTRRYNGKNSGDKEEEYHGKFDFEMEQLYLVNYLLTKMNSTELSGALYYQVYAYSASMVKNMQNDIKDVVYINDGVEVGSHYTTIDPVAADADTYAVEKINVIYGQTFTSWNGTGVKGLGDGAGNQPWDAMNDEIMTAIKYDYTHMEIDQKSEAWKERCERLEDLVVVRVWSCCGQKVHLAKTENCTTNHSYNPKDGSKATKEYDTEHNISLFVKNYENVLYHVAGQTTLSFSKATKGYETNGTDASKTYKSGYNGDIAALRASAEVSMSWDTKNPRRKITISSGKKFVDEIADADSTDVEWWNTNKTSGSDVAFDSHTQNLTVGGQSTVFTYSYTFAGWYLDENCKYKFNEDDEINVNLIIYAGYNVTKSR